MDNKTNKHEFACNAGKVTEYEVKEHIDTIMVGFRGFSKEVSIVKWNDKKPVFDIRAYNWERAVTVVVAAFSILKTAWKCAMIKLVN